MKRKDRDIRDCGCEYTPTEWRSCDKCKAAEKVRHEAVLAEHRRQYETVPVTAI